MASMEQRLCEIEAALRDANERAEIDRRRIQSLETAVKEANLRADDERVRAEGLEIALRNANERAARERANAQDAVRMAAQSARDAQIAGAGPLYVPQRFWYLPYLKLSCREQHQHLIQSGY